ncbi:MAG: hypothetical protein P1V20_29465 [Verrucomicrobiales bacterium]|nr:hypothetical protein [Verrucomicrobiales bacterium]
MKRTLSWVGIVFLAGIFIAVFVNVLEMRLSKGDIYPHYATFRTDPLGSSGLYEAFGRIPGLTVERNQESLMKIDNLDKDTALFLLGVPQSSFSRIRIPDDSPVLEAIKEEGLRLIVTVDPGRVPQKHINTLSNNEQEWLEKRRREREERQRKIKEGKQEEEKPVEKKKKDLPKEEEADDDFDVEIELERIAALGPKMQDRFGISIADVKKFDRPEEGWPTTRGDSLQKNALPDKTPLWKSQYRFSVDSEHREEWKIAATVAGAPVLAERKLGKGSIVFATDSFFASNDALYSGADSAFLLWLTGGKTRLVFDETMHGSVESTGAIKLLRQYRLHGFLIGIFVFVVLWAWKSASSLSPGDEAAERGIIGADGAVSGEDAKSGLVRLLQRSIPGNELIDRCLATWGESQTTKLPVEKERQIREIARQHKVDFRSHSILDTYRKISEVLRRK